MIGIVLYLIITKEKNRQGRHAVDSYEKTALLKLVDNIPRRNFVAHGESPSTIEEYPRGFAGSKAI